MGKEPRVSRRWRGHDIEIRSRDIERIRVKYPGHDCDAMVVDPSNGDILLFTKSNRRHGSKVYKVPQGSGHSKTKTKRLQYVTTLPNMLVTGADISPSGDILALTNNGEGWRWRKSDGLMAWADFLKTGPNPCRLYQEEQLETITVADGGNSQHWGGRRGGINGGRRDDSRGGRGGGRMGGRRAGRRGGRRAGSGNSSRSGIRSRSR